MKKFLQTKMGFFFVAATLLWLKSYLIYVIEFNLDIKNSIQSFLLFINPISSVLIFLGIALFAKGKKAGIWIMTIDFLMSFFLYANVVFYRFNNDYITLPTLTQTGNFASLGGSILSLMEWYDIFYAIDLLLLVFLFMKTKHHWSNERLQFRKPMLVLIAGAIAFSINLGMAEADRPQLLKRTFDRNYIVKYLGAYNFAIYDTIQNIKSSSQRVLADSNDIDLIKEYTTDKYAEPNPELFGAAKGKNIIKIHLESFQSFLIDYELHGEEVTPFLNSLVHDQSEGFTYFDNFFHQTEQGKTADAEFMLDNSLYGLPQGAAFVTKANNTYQALPAILNQKLDYTSAVLHGDYKTFWNRDEVYKRFGIDHYFDASYYDMSDENIINYGLKDKPFFEESIPMLESLDKPFYAHLITLTHHHPYLIDEDDATIEPAETGDGSVDRFFQTARYLDEALKEFFDELKEAGLYEDSLIYIYGDHYGISENHNRAMGEVLDKEVTPLVSANLQRVPFFIRIPGVESEGINHRYTGQMDVMPALLHLMGIRADDYILFGTDMLSKDHIQVVPFRRGDFITPEYSYVSGTFYDNETEEEIEDITRDMEKMKQRVEQELQLSDKVVYGDLLRFYTPTKDWEEVDPSIYQYGLNEEDNDSDPAMDDETDDSNPSESEEQQEESNEEDTEQEESK